LSVDDALLLGRVLFLVALYLFLAALAVLLWRELRSRVSTATERAPADLLIVEPFDTGLEPGERIPLLAVSTIGRDSENDVVLQDSFLSTYHAKLSWNRRGWVLEDLGSTNGTRVAGKPVRKAMAIKTGETIEFGRVKVKLVPI
jgi:hypothetical protein